MGYPAAPAAALGPVVTADAASHPPARSNRYSIMQASPSQASPLLLPGGIVALVFVDRTGAPAIKLRTSTDGGRTWPAASEVVLYGAVVATQTTAKTTMNDAWSEMAKFSVGLPATARTVEGDLLVAYYAGPHFDRTSIEWVRVGS